MAVGVTEVGMFGSKNQALWVIPLVGGAPAVRFVKRFSELLVSGELLGDKTDIAIEEVEGQINITGKTQS